MILKSHSWAYIQRKSKVKSLSRVQLFATPWTVHGILQVEYWSG